MMKKPEKVLLIFNPYAASKRASRLLKPILEEFKKYDIGVGLRITRFQKEAISIVLEEDLEGFDAIIAAGGDGTLFEVINGYFRRPDKPKIPIGVIPIGTGNAFARDIQLKYGEWRKSIELISYFNIAKIDVGCFITAGEKHYFLNILGIGFVADVTRIAYQLKWLGNIAYTLGVLWQLLFLKRYQLEISIDDAVYHVENTFVEISNTRYTSNFLMAPNARIDDGLFDITLLNGISRSRLLKMFPKVFTGEHIYINEITTYKAKKIELKTPNPKILAPDGELLGITPIEVYCMPKALSIITNKLML